MKAPRINLENPLHRLVVSWGIIIVFLIILIGSIILVGDPDPIQVKTYGWVGPCKGVTVTIDSNKSGSGWTIQDPEHQFVTIYIYSVESPRSAGKAFRYGTTTGAIPGFWTSRWPGENTPNVEIWACPNLDTAREVAGQMFAGRVGEIPFCGVKYSLWWGVDMIQEVYEPGTIKATATTGNGPRATAEVPNPACRPY